MITQTKGKIYLTDDRGVNELECVTSFSTFNFGKYFNAHKIPFGALYVLNEDTLAGEASKTMNVEKDSAIILLPTIGDIEFSNNNGDAAIIQVGQAQHSYARANTSFTVTNPYKNDQVSFLQIWIAAPDITTTVDIAYFDIDARRNRLHNIFPQTGSSNHNIAIGKFDGREEEVYALHHPNNDLFAFVIEGAFEVQHRLLQTGDGLALWDLYEAEMEALSNDAVLLVIEVSKDK